MIIQLHNETTQQRFTHNLDKSGEFFLALPAGRYWITEVWYPYGGWARTIIPFGEGPHFIVPPGAAIYLGTLSVRLPFRTQKGEMTILDEFQAATRRLQAQYPARPLGQPLVKGLMFSLPKKMDDIFVDAILNGKVAVPLQLDMSATYTTLTMYTARDLGITAIQDLPKQRVQTGGRVVVFPITTLRSIRVGTEEVRDVEVAIDVEGHLRIGLLGMTFLRHFRVTVDQERGQAKFERQGMFTN